MANNEKKVWGIHTQNDNLFLNNNVIAIGWNDMGNLSSIDPSRDEFKRKYAQIYPDVKKGSIATGAGMLYRFCNEVQPGDYVVFPSKSNREVNIGEVKGEYVYNSTQIEYAHSRKVNWLKHLPRTFFSQGALYEIGSALTLFSVRNYADEFMNALQKNFKKYDSSDSDDESVGQTADDIMENTKDFILKELSRQLKGYNLESFVSDLLQAMGYRTFVSPQGGDSGIDITAYKDEFPPRILVQVKSCDVSIKEETIQSLKGAMREGDYGLFVTLSTYTKNAQKYLNSSPIIRGINGTELVDLILKYYDSLHAKYRNMIPLKQVYIPVPKED
ncbi:restriction endonuclease [Lacticaseibacillus paracasei]|uniref:restriction endonuclease n=1 Tax=Lacticaseibacillus paracasei TaxID=1597 RepID=UPI002F26C4A6